MKKLFVSLAMVFTMFLAGFTLSACGSDTIKLTFLVEKQSQPLVKVVVKQDGKEVEGRGYNYNLKKGLNLRVEIVAGVYGADFSEVVVKVNGVNREIIKNRDYDPGYGSENLVYGNFTLANINEKLNVTISGVKQSSIDYSFEVENADDETAIFNMKNAYIDVEGNGTFTNFYDFVINPESKLVRNFADSNYNSFNIRFADPERGDDIFDLLNSTAFKGKLEDGTEVGANYTFSTNGYYVISFPNVKDTKYKVVVDFKDFKYRQYAVYAPEDNLNFSISAPISLNYATKSEVVITKSEKRKSLVYDNIKVYINNKELELATDCDLQNDSDLRFIIPDKITPFSTSELGEVTYMISVEGIGYADEAYDVKIADEFVQEQSPIKNPKIVLLVDGEQVGEIPQQNGSCKVVKGEKIALLWEYEYDEQIKAFVSNFDLYDFDVEFENIISDGSEETGTQAPARERVTKVFSLAEKIDLTKKETQSVVLEEGYILTAYYDEEKGGFACMQLEFSCESNKEINLKNFKPYAQDVRISYNFQDPHISSVEYDIVEGGELNWTTLQKDSSAVVRVESGKIIAFRLVGDAYADTKRFIIEDENIVLENPEVLTYIQGNVHYTELRFVVSDKQFSEIQNVKLIIR